MADILLIALCGASVLVCLAVLFCAVWRYACGVWHGGEPRRKRPAGEGAADDA